MRWGRLAVANHRGVLVPRALGIALAAVATTWTLAYAAVREIDAGGWGALAGVLLVFAAGLVDDVSPVGPRGLRSHLRSLAEGHVTTGILKLFVTAGVAVVVVALQPGRPAYARLAGVVLLASSANVWNGLDTRPGRALKAFLVPAAAFLAWGATPNAPALVGLLAAALIALPIDLAEAAMLGDGGANALGFAAGLALYDVLPDPWVVAAAVAAVALNVVADTVSFGAVIEAARPLRWLDALGRRA